MNKYLETVAQKNNLKIAKDYIYGEINGYMFTVRQVKTVIIVNTNITSDITPEQSNYIIGLLSGLDKSYGLYKKQTAINTTNISVTFSSKFKKDVNLFSGYAQFITDNLKQLNKDGADVCVACREKNDKELVDVALNVGNYEYVTRMHRECNEDVNKEINDAYTAMDDESNLFSGVIGAFLGALAGSGVWIIIYLFGYVTSIGGIIIGLAANFGYKKLRGPRGAVQIVVVVIFIIIAIVLAQYTFEVMACSYFLRLDGQQPTIGEVMTIVNNELVISSEYLSIFLRSIGSGLFYGTIGIIYVVIKMVRENKKVTAKIIS